MKKVLIIGSMFGTTSEISSRVVVDIYKTLFAKKYNVFPLLIIGLDDLDKVMNRISFDGVFVATYGGLTATAV